MKAGTSRLIPQQPIDNLELDNIVIITFTKISNHKGRGT